MAKGVNEGNKTYVYFSPTPTVSDNGLYVVLAGRTFPSPDYYMYREERTGIFWGGMYVFEYIISGKGHIHTYGEEIEVGAGDFVFMNAKKNIEYWADKNDPYEKIWINFTGPFVEGIVKSLSLDQPVLVLKYNAEENILKLHKTLASVNDENRSSRLDTVAADICSIFLKINYLRRHRERYGENIKTSTAEKIRNYIDSLVIPKVDLDDISVKFGLDKGYIVHRFTKKYGISPYKYITAKKIECAKIMLREKSMTISEISSSLGYSGTQHFSSSFKKATGKTPTEYAHST